MRAVAAGCERSAVISEVKSRFSVRKIIDIKSVCVQTRRQIIGRDEINNRRETRIGTNFQQALDDFDWSKASHRVSVSCHVFPSASLSSSFGSPDFRQPVAERPVWSCTHWMYALNVAVVRAKDLFLVTTARRNFVIFTEG